MKLWPSESFAIETTMSLNEIVDTLNAYIEPKKVFRGFSEHNVFEGQVTHDGFKVVRVISYRNSFLPVITGTFTPGQSGITVSINMRLHAFVSAFMCVWFGGVGIGMVFVLVVLVSGQAKPDAMFLIPFAMLIFGCVLVTAPFWWEAKKAKRILTEMFQKKQDTEQSHP